MFVLLCGYPPFYGGNKKAIFKNITKGKFKFDKDEWADISDDAKDLIQKLLVKDVDKRFTAGQALHHDWI